MSTKLEIRKQNKLKLLEVDDKKNTACQTKILEKILSKFDFENKNILIYNSKKNELGTNLIIEKLSQIANVFLPKTTDKMEIVRLCKDSKFVVGKFGIVEIEGEIEDKNILDYAIIPCVAVDETGNRVGYGGGYFDRFLQDTNIIKIAICFDFQVEKHVESEEFDQKMDFILTERRMIICE